MVILIFAMAINILAMLFGPLSPLVLVSTLLVIMYERNDTGDSVSKRNRIISFLITAIIGSLCVIFAYHLPYHDYYPNTVRGFCESIGAINLYFTTSNIMTKSKDFS
jgi:hypothetical protein